MQALLDLEARWEKVRKGARPILDSEVEATASDFRAFMFPILEIQTEAKLVSGLQLGNAIHFKNPARKLDFDRNERCA